MIIEPIEIMKKMYNTPIIEMQPMVADAHVMLLESGSALSPAPARHSVAPPVPGGSL